MHHALFSIHDPPLESIRNSRLLVSAFTRHRRHEELAERGREGRGMGSRRGMDFAFACGRACVGARVLVVAEREK